MKFVLFISFFVSNMAFAGQVTMPLNASEVNEQNLKMDCRRHKYGFEFPLCVRVLAAQLPPLDPNKRDHFGEFYDPEKWLECMLDGAKGGHRLTGHCERYRLRRKDNPEYWPYPNVAKPTLPEAPNPPTYKPGMTSEEYFKALCEKEAGEFIYKTVENVEGIYQIRPRQREGDYEMEDRYVMEDPYGHDDAEATEPENFFVRPNRYLFFERPLAKTFLEITKYSGETLATTKNYFTKLRKENVTTPQSRYGFTWRGIHRPQDRQMGIVGGELLIIDLKTNEILAVRRGFLLSGNVKNTPTKIWWLSAKACPQDRLKNYYAYSFINKVIKPLNVKKHKYGE